MYIVQNTNKKHRNRQGLWPKVFESLQKMRELITDFQGIDQPLHLAWWWWSLNRTSMVCHQCMMSTTSTTTRAGNPPHYVNICVIDDDSQCNLSITKAAHAYIWNSWISSFIICLYHRSLKPSFWINLSIAENFN